MKRFGNLYEKICDLENIKLAHINARRGKSRYKEVQLVDEDPDYYVLKVREMLLSKSFVNSEYRTFIKLDKGKERVIYSLPYFPDRIIHHCILQIIEPIWKKTLIRDTYSSIKGRGIHDGWKRVVKALKDKENSRYCLKLDIRKFYPSVDHQILKQIIRKKIKCQDTLWLLDEIIDSTHGIPIGNYLSQYFGNIYLSGLDHFIKEECQVRYYFRYCDDMVLLLPDKETLHTLLGTIREYVGDRLSLELKSNYQIFPVEKQGLDFLGYRFFSGHIRLRKRIAEGFKRKVDYIKNNFMSCSGIEVLSGIMSYSGWLKYANGRVLKKKYLDPEVRTMMCLSMKRIKTKAGIRRTI